MRGIKRRGHFFRPNESGSALVETSLAVLLSFPLILVVFETCAFCYTQALIGDAARAGVRYAIVHGTDSSSCSGPSTGCSDLTGANIVSMVHTYAGSLMSRLSTAIVNPSWPDGSSAPPSRVLVTISYTYSPIFANVGGPITMTASAEGRIVY